MRDSRSRRRRGLPRAVVDGVRRVPPDHPAVDRLHDDRGVVVRGVRRARRGCDPCGAVRGGALRLCEHAPFGSKAGAGGRWRPRRPRTQWWARRWWRSGGRVRGALRFAATNAARTPWRRAVTCTSTARRPSSWRRSPCRPCRWAAMNPQARYRDPLTVEDVLASPYQVAPLHTLDCCLVTDGAGAFVMTTAEGAARSAQAAGVRARRRHRP